MKLSLNKEWKLLYRDLSTDANQVLDVFEAEDYIDAGNLPCDAHVPLIKAGIIKDPVVADYSYDCEWMERKSWWYRKDFEITPKDLASRSIRLVIESLDLFAQVFINGRFVGKHQSCHFPFTADIAKYLKAGTNSLLVCLTMGPEGITRSDYDYLAEYICTETDGGRGDRGEKARAFLRKPQYVYGWDWGPRIGTVGIMKNAWIDFLGDITVTCVHPLTLEVNKDAASVNAKLRFETEFESLLPISTQEAYLRLEVKYADKIVYSENRNVLALSGTNYADFEATLQDAKLWWPNGAGEQPLYSVELTVKGAKYSAKSDPVRFGIRTIELDLEKYGENDHRFAFKVNGSCIYCKGGNWIPADSVYGRVNLEKYRSLISEAKECNFNMLRIWGGGIYERDEFYDFCDEAGILLWHDFMFACSLYPDDQKWYKELVRIEIEYQTKRLRRHPCMALWCGNNENPMIFTDYFCKDPRDRVSGGLTIYNEIIPSIIRANCPEIPYWPSSPYGGKDPNDNEVGDRHHWGDCTMNPNMENRITPEAYDKVSSRFITEYGYIGPCSEETIKKYYGDNPVIHNDRIWYLHNNTFEKATVPEGIRKHYADPESLNLEDYLRYARLVQGLMYSYSLEAIRFCPKNDGSLFWMYNDTWGEVGWAIIDYYLDRKPSFYFVKRAFEPVKFILRFSADKKKIHVMGCNDTSLEKKIELEYGYVSFAGQYETKRKTVTLPAFSKSIGLEFTMPKGDVKKGLVFARGDGIPLAILRTGDFRKYTPAGSVVTVIKIEEKGKDLAITLKSSGYSHAVSLDLHTNFHLDDEFFDMLPEDVRTVLIKNAAGKLKKESIKPIFLKTGG
ncbi:MAG: beta-mannosidase [Treponema sp.]|jgi:beta-mannosidase|nr:beta-mannosidase [Treponema sp.]